MMSETAPASSWQESSGRSGDEWMAWAALFELASMGFLPPTEDLAQALVTGEYAEACDEAAMAVGRAGAGDVGVAAAGCLDAYRGRDSREVFHELRREWTRLFVGEREPLITPYAGVRYAQARGERGVLMVGEESMAIERLMRRCGMAKDLSAGQSNDPVDHVGTMCEFMQYLCLVAARAVAVPTGASADETDAPAFMGRHFAPYATWCAAELREKARIPYYQFLAWLVDRLV